MEFKVFKNENSKILKEYWLTQSEWDTLDKTTVQEGDIYHIVGTIDKGDLSADVNASLAKADSSLQKPTTTLAKESFVKVGIDGTQKFDESSYVVAPSTDGTAGQVLKKTETGTVWAYGSGGADTLEAKLNENIVKDPSKTYLVWKGNSFPNSTSSSVAFKALAGCTIDWGDGNVETFETASTEVTTHTYTDGFEYHLISLLNYNNLGSNAFYDCDDLISVAIGNGVTSIGSGAFYECSNLVSVIIGAAVTSIGYSAFYKCGRLTSVIIPSSVTSIGNGAFSSCNRLSNIMIGDGVPLFSKEMSIGDEVFYSCPSLTGVTIGNNVKKIGKRAFKGCRYLKIIKMLLENPPTLSEDLFIGTPIEKIIVPKSAIDTYKSAATWSTYADKIVYEVDSSDLNSGGGKLYKHNVQIKYNSGLKRLVAIFYTSNSTPIDTISKIASGNSYIDCVYIGANGTGSVMMIPYAVTGTMDVGGVVGSSKDSTTVNVYESGLTPTEITDTVSEV